MTDAPLRFGLIGVDSAHSVQFTRLLGDGRTGSVTGATVSSAWQGPTIEDFPPSRLRNDAFGAELSTLGVPLRGSPEDVAAESDALLLVSSDVRTHRSLFSRVVAFGKPVYVDTRFARTLDDARNMLDEASASGCLVLAGSPKRFTPEFREAAAGPDIVAAEFTGPVPTQPSHEGLAWYGVHLVDLAVATMGTGCTSVEDVDGRLRLHWSDGRVAEIGGPSEWNPFTRGVVHRPASDRQFVIEANQDMLRGLLSEIITACRSERMNVTSDEILETVAIVEAGSAALRDGGAVSVA